MLSILKTLIFTKWSKQKELIFSTFKVNTCCILEYVNIIWSPTISNTNIKKLQTIQSTALRIATGCIQDTNTQHLHDKISVLLMDTQLKLHTANLNNLLKHKHTLYITLMHIQILRLMKWLPNVKKIYC